jgi:hypothetical protein
MGGERLDGVPQSCAPVPGAHPTTEESEHSLNKAAVLSTPASYNLGRMQPHHCIIVRVWGCIRPSYNLAY